MHRVSTEYPDDLLLAMMVDRWGVGAFDLLDRSGLLVLRVWALQGEIDRIRKEK